MPEEKSYQTVVNNTGQGSDVGRYYNSFLS